MILSVGRFKNWCQCLQRDISTTKLTIMTGFVGEGKNDLEKKSEKEWKNGKAKFRQLTKFSLK